MGDNSKKDSCEKPKEQEIPTEETSRQPLLVCRVEDFQKFFPHVKGARETLGLGKHNDPTRKYRRQMKGASRKRKAEQEPVRINTEFIKAMGCTSAMRNNALLPF